MGDREKEIIERREGERERREVGDGKEVFLKGSF